MKRFDDQGRRVIWAGKSSMRLRAIRRRSPNVVSVGDRFAYRLGPDDAARPDINQGTLTIDTVWPAVVGCSEDGSWRYGIFIDTAAIERAEPWDFARPTNERKPCQTTT